jgi:ferritin-like metal-binding protein YciE
MAINSPRELMAIKLRQIQDAETEAARALGDLQGQVQNPQLKQMLQQRLKEGEEVMRGVRQALPKFDGQTSSAQSQNQAARGIIEEARTFMREVQPPELKEVIAIGSVQSLEHYCIATWGTVKALAEEMGEQDVVEIMEKALESGKELDARLSDLAENRVNPRATEGGGGGDARV